MPGNSLFLAKMLFLHESYVVNSSTSYNIYIHNILYSSKCRNKIFKNWLLRQRVFKHAKANYYVAGINKKLYFVCVYISHKHHKMLFQCKNIIVLISCLEKSIVL